MKKIKNNSNQRWLSIVFLIVGLAVLATPNTQAQMIRNTGLPISINKALVVNKMGDWVNDQGSSITNNGTIVTSDNWVNNGTYTSGSAGGFDLNYSTPKTFTLGGTNLGKLKVDGSAGVTLGSITIADSLALVNGVISLSTNADVLTLPATAIISGGNNSSYVDGVITRTGKSDLLFPLGLSGNYLPVTLFDVKGSSPVVTASVATAPSLSAGSGIESLIGFPYAWTVNTLSPSDTASSIEVQYPSTLPTTTSPIVAPQTSPSTYGSLGAASFSNSDGVAIVQSYTPALHGLFSVAKGLSANFNGISVMPILADGFTIAWNAIPDATGYQLDISTDNFATFISGYNSKNTAALTETVTGLSGNTVYQFRIRATANSGSVVSPNSNVVLVTTLKKDQSINFSSLATVSFGDPAFQLPATATSGLVVTYTSSNTAVATVIDNTVTVVGPGTTTITASQAGDASYNAASDVAQTLTVNKGEQTITFNTLQAKTIGDGAFQLPATATSGLVVTFSTTSTNVSIAGATVTIISSGSVTINADQTGNANYNAAPTVSQTFCVNPAQPTITLSGVNSESPTLTSSASSDNQWFLDGSAIASATNQTLIVNAAGTYTVQVSVGSCQSAMSADEVLIVTGDIKTFSNDQGISLYPNPSRSTITISLESLDSGSSASIQIFDMLGRSFKELSGEGGAAVNVDISNYAVGNYIVKVTQSGNIYHGRFTKQ